MEDFERIGWIKLYRKLADHPRFSDGDWLKVWIACLLLATHKPYRVIFGRNEITLQPGQFITSQRSLFELTKVQASKIERILRQLVVAKQIEKRGATRSRLITILQWVEYQGDRKSTDKGSTNQGQAGDNKQEWEEEKESPPPSPPPLKGRRRQAKTLIPDNWYPDRETLTFCEEQGLSDPDYQRLLFINHWKSKGEARADWNATFRNWMLSPLRKERNHGAYQGRAGSFESQAQRNARAAGENYGAFLPSAFEEGESD